MNLVEKTFFLYFFHLKFLSLKNKNKKSLIFFEIFYNIEQKITSTTHFFQFLFLVFWTKKSGINHRAFKKNAKLIIIFWFSWLRAFKGLSVNQSSKEYHQARKPSFWIPHKFRPNSARILPDSGEVLAEWHPKNPRDFLQESRIDGFRFFSGFF